MKINFQYQNNADLLSMGLNSSAMTIQLQVDMMKENAKSRGESVSPSSSGSSGGVPLCPRCDRPPVERPRVYRGHVPFVAQTLGILTRSVARPLAQNAVMSQRRI